MLSKKAVTSRLYQYAGYAVAASCLIFIGLQIRKYFNILSVTFSSGETLWRLCWTSFVYAGLFLLLAAGWCVLYRSLAGRASFFETYYTYTRTSIAKYLPGNVGHFVGRQLIATRFGMSQAGVSISSGLEIMCQVVGALILCLWIDLPMAPPISPLLSFLLASGILFLAPFAILWAGRKKSLNLNSVGRGKLWLTIALVIGLDILFFIAVGGIVYLFSLQLHTAHQLGFMTFVTAYGVAWFLGLVTPGAPAGFGVREVVLATLLTPSIGAGNAFTVAVQLRVATTLGDVLFFMSSYLVPLKDMPEQTQPQNIL